MGLLEELEDIDSQLEEAQTGEETTSEPDPTPDPEPSPEPDVTPDTEPEPEEEEPKPEPAKTDSDFARERRENKAKENARIAALEAKLAEQEKQLAAQSQPKTVNDDPEPDKTANYEGWLEWQDRKNQREIDQLKSVVTPFVEQQRKAQAFQAAANELQQIEAEAKTRLPHYDEVSKFYTEKVTESFKIMYPSASLAQIQQAVAQKILHTASQYAQQGYNPVEQMHQDALDMGFTPSTPETPAAPPKPDIKKLAQNQQRNAGTGAAKGKAEDGDITDQRFANMTVGEFAALSPEQRARIGA